MTDINPGPGKKSIAMITIDLKKVEKLAMRGLKYVEIAQVLNISEDTLQNRRNDQIGVQEAIDRGRALGVSMVAKKLFNGALTGNLNAGQMRAIEYYMNNCANWSSNPKEQMGDTHNYFIVGEAKAESAEAWVSQHKPTALPSQKEH